MTTFPTSAPISVVLDVPAGRVRLVAADRADTTVEVLPADAAKGRDAKAAEQTRVEYGDGVLRITAPSGGQILGPSGSVEITVHLPAGSGVEAKTASLELQAAGRLGEVALEGAHGPVEIEEAAGVRLATDAGDVRIGRLSGSADITTAKGDITITEAVRGTVVLRTQAGQITVGAAPGVSASLDAGTSHGRITNALKNDGTADLAIQATTAHGDITARSL
ncbi:DUF4097 family beta strand repeat-containing protein [Actinocorallia populi]|uniref:DUF4097 family beta strand repeat-containing protein n=1 Tax=Actinocorallia populi TaxID=2079200 RepID=UPI000D0903CA|nr:DUF4097 family beta strand repeat-containing protein [Actinocorallia populi]